jgi:hypothetical protein
MLITGRSIFASASLRAGDGNRPALPLARLLASLFRLWDIHSASQLGNLADPLGYRSQKLNSVHQAAGIELRYGTPRRLSPRSGSAWLGRSQKDGLPSRSRGRRCKHIGSRPSTRASGGQRPGCPFLFGSKREAGMDAKTRNLALLAALSLFCAGFAFVAAVELAGDHWR